MTIHSVRFLITDLWATHKNGLACWSIRVKPRTNDTRDRVVGIYLFDGSTQQSSNSNSSYHRSMIYGIAALEYNGENDNLSKIM